MDKKQIGSAIWRMDRTLQEVNEELMENGGELTSELQTRLDDAGLTAEQVADGLQQLITKTKSEDAMIGDEIKRLQALKKARANAIEGLKGYLLSFMQNNGIKRIEGTYCNATINAGQVSTVVDEDTLLQPFNHKVNELNESLPSWVQAELKLDKKALKETFKDKDVTPAGVQFVKSPFVVIK